MIHADIMTKVNNTPIDSISINSFNSNNDAIKPAKSKIQFNELAS
jgi:hypothetical protein